MSKKVGEEEELRSATLQTERSIFLARRRAEEELARTAEKLRRSERELSDFFENAAVGLHWVGPDGIILRANKTELEMLGYDRAEYVGHHISEFHVDKDNVADLLARLGAGEVLHEHEARMRCKDGTIKDVLIDSSVLWEDGKFLHTRCFTRDITSQKRVEDIQARLVAIVESSQDAIVSKTTDGIILSWNEGAQQLFGYQPREVIGRPITIIIPPDRLDEERQILERSRRGERVEHYETVRVTRDGRRIDVSLTISPVRDRAGHIVGISKIARDISAKKRAEQRLAMQHRVTHTLAEAPTLQDAAPRILEAICAHVEWQAGGIWYVDDQNAVLRCAEVYHVSGTEIPRFEAFTRATTFQKDVGLPGRVWADGTAHWVGDVAGDPNFPRAVLAKAEGLHAALGVPIVLNEQVLGVIEFFSREIRQPDAELLEMMKSIGSQVGQFIERRRAEAALRESEQRFRLMASNIPSIIWTAAPDGSITYANDRWFEYCGLTPAEDASGWPEMVLHPEDRERCMAAWAASRRQGTPYEVEVRIRRHDGAYRWFVMRAVPSRDSTGTVARWFGTTTDIHDQKQAEHTTRFLADASAAFATLTDYESTLQKVATLSVPHFADWCTIEMQEADGTIRRLATTHADTRRIHQFRELLTKYPPGGEERFGTRHVLRTGESEWAAKIADEILVAAAKDEEHLRVLRDLGLKSYISVPLKSRTRVLGVITFVTAESGRSYDADDLRAAEDLAHRAVIAIENASLLATLREADRRKDEFLAMLAHELRNPLAPIRNAVEIFRVKGPPAPELRWATDVIDRQVHQMTRLVDDLLDVSRITRGKIDLRREIVDVASVVNTALEASRPVIEKWGHQLTVTVPERPVKVVADPARLAQVLANLLHNAAKYTDHAGRIQLTVEAKDDNVVIRVKDNGVGIPPEALPRIFDMFTQVDHSIERSEGGLGIGLTLVRRLVEMHGGVVEARSEGVGRGSEFIVRLPVAAEHAAAHGPSGGPTLTITRARRILIVDDNQDAADSLGMLLRMLGNEVHTAHDGLEAVGAASAFQPDVVLLDIGLPKLSGYEAAKQIRAQPGGSRMLIIALTGWGQDEDRRRTKEAGFNHHMTKPVEFETLLHLLADTTDDDRGGR